MFILQHKIIKFAELNDTQKKEAIKIFVDGFGHLFFFTKNKDIMQRLFLQSLNPQHILLYVENEIVLGILGISTNKVRPMKLDIDTCKELFGKIKGSIICTLSNFVFQKPAVKEDTDLYLETLTTSETARNKGVATALLQHSLTIESYENVYLEVFSKNIDAKRLYEKIGFVECSKKRFSPTSLLGFGYTIKMKNIK